MSSCHLEMLPEALDDELLFSRIARYARLIGETAARPVLGRLLGNAMATPASALPSGLFALAAYFGKHDSADSILQNATHYPFYAAYLGEGQRKTLRKSMLESRCGGAKLAIGIVASRIGAFNRLRLCRDCFDAESADGIAFWHRCHQLPGALMCHAHQRPLLDASQVVVRRRHALVLPEDVLVSAKEIAVRPEQRGRAQESARMTAAMLLNPAPAHGAEELSRRYRLLAENCGLLTSSGSIRHAQLRARLSGYWDCLADIPEFRWLTASSWHEDLLRGRRRSIHPLKHAVLCAVLGCLPTDLPASPVLPIAAGEEDDPIARHDPEDTPLDRALLAVSIGKSCRSAAVAHGISVGTVLVAAHRSGLAVSCRSKVIDARLTKIVRESLTSGLPLKTIASATCLSNSSVWRILKADAALEAAWADARWQALSTLHRDRWSKLLSESDSASLKELRRLEPASYAWLYREDRVWLGSANAGRSRPLQPRLRNMDRWASHDWRWSTAIERLAAQILAIEPPAGRASRSRLLRELFIDATFRLNRERLPHTARTLEAASESVVAYQVRRVRFWRAELPRRGLEPSAWLVRKKAGLPETVCEEVLTALEGLGPVKKLRSQINALERVC